MGLSHFNIISNESARRFIYLIICLLLTAIIFTGWVCTNWIRDSYDCGVNDYDPARFVDMVYGKAHRPFVYRTLLPTTVRLITAAIPAKTRAQVNQFAAGNRLVVKAFSRLHWELEHFIEYATGTALMYLSLLGFVFALRCLLVACFRAPRVFADVVPLVALLGVRYLAIRYIHYVYDLPTLFLFTLGLALMVHGRWRLFLIVYAAGCLNKETTILLTLVFVIHFLDKERMDRRLFSGLLLSQLAIFFSTELVLLLAFRDNPGSPIEFHLLDRNFGMFLRFLANSSLSAEFTWFAVAVLTFYKWSSKPAFLRHGIWMLVPLLMLIPFLGQLDELRVYYEVYPVVVLLLSHTISDIMAIEVVSLEENGRHNT